MKTIKMVFGKFMTVAFTFAVIAGFSGITSEVEAKTVVKKPTVVIIGAEWCRACQKVDPIMKGLMKEYKDKLDFVVLDVTNEEAEAKSYEKAKSLGLASFFKKYKKKTSTVAIFKGKTKVFQTVKNYDRSAYVDAFDKAIGTMNSAMVVIIGAEWCRACQKVDPIMKGLMKEYKDKLDFVVLDVTNEDAEAKSYEKAKSLGLASFFKKYKKKTSTVAIFKGKTKVFQTVKNYDRSAYVDAFDKALDADAKKL